MNPPANAAIREQRRRSSPLHIEQMNVMKALTAAEYSRRQFVLNYAASRDTQLLVPGQKADAIKQAEEWATAWLNQNGFGTSSGDLFKYTVDARLWATLVGSDIEFPFAFMHCGSDTSTPSSASSIAKRPVTELFPAEYEIQVHHVDNVPTVQEPPPARRQSKHLAPQEQPLRREPSSKKKKQTPEAAAEKRRSLSLYSLEDVKMTKKLNQDKFPLLTRLGRSFSRRLSG